MTWTPEQNAKTAARLIREMQEHFAEKPKVHKIPVHRKRGNGKA